MVQKRNSKTFRESSLIQNSPFKEADEDTINLNERYVAIMALIFSLSVLTAKLLFTNSDDLYNLLFEKRLVEYKTIITDGEVLLLYAWKNVWKYSRFWFPAVCGGLITWFTWLMVFLDSSVPGVTPPSPLSPAKFKIQSGHTFHLNYMFAVVIGVAVATYMYVNGIGLEF